MSPLASHSTSLVTSSWSAIEGSVSQSLKANKWLLEVGPVAQVSGFQEY